MSCKNGNTLASPLICTMEVFNATYNPYYNIFSKEEAPFPHVPSITAANLRCFRGRPYPNDKSLYSRRKVTLQHIHSSVTPIPVAAVVIFVIASVSVAVFTTKRRGFSTMVVILLWPQMLDV